MVPVVYKTAVAADLRVIAFSTGGAVIADRLVTQGSSSETTGGDSYWDDCIARFWYIPHICPIAAIFRPNLGTFEGSDFLPLESAGFPLPGVAIRPDPQGGAPFVMLTDGKHDKVAYSFSPQTGFAQVSRSSHLIRTFTTPPVVLPNGDTLTGTYDGYLTRTGPNFVQLSAIGGLGTLTAAPTRLSDGSRDSEPRGYHDRATGSPQPNPARRRIHRVGRGLVQSHLRRHYERLRDLRPQDLGAGCQRALDGRRTAFARDRAGGSGVRHRLKHALRIRAAVESVGDGDASQLRALAAGLESVG